MVLPASSKVGLDNYCPVLNVYDVAPPVRRINETNQLANTHLLVFHSTQEISVKCLFQERHDVIPSTGIEPAT